ncbi:hypothetical protein TVAG_475890 [Trichomonas vaginalis G3]|uniref:Kelch motif family protein n=1 Tax=Trichomonas vaginalis (strain ATCC PRA-98 / G3) TaxID=412133 RepID=A2DA13_TRIV3|nr:nitrile biosynthetic process [Trichomonas vaginalis G3]EAY22661.1 hypothetical protein TVAG_475890 [Trichomonas vaginalis G3]KAI5525475.1 nitrile biosynthetic process [Trichomonas vaginalis G3]|eukprot:XP_001583647.1 hypothetical protein [Trichomonas vaginalis G3]
MINKRCYSQIGMKFKGISRQASITSINKRRSSNWLNLNEAVPKTEEMNPILPLLSPISTRIGKGLTAAENEEETISVAPPTNSTFYNGLVYQITLGEHGYLEVYSAKKGESFTLLQAKRAPSNRTGFCFTFLDKHHLFLYGGYAANLQQNEMYILDIEDREWRMCKIIAPPQAIRTNTQCISTLDENYHMIYVFGGSEGPKLLGSLDIIIFCKDSFKYINPMCSIRSYCLKEGPCGRAGHTFIKMNDKGYLFGGVDTRGKCLGDLWEFNFSNALNPTWALLSNIGPNQRKSHISYLFDNGVCIAGGVNDENNFIGDVWKWDSRWIRLSVFETSFPVFGSEEGLLYYDKILRPIEYMNAGRHLDAKFAQLRKIQSLHKAASIVEKEAESSTVFINTNLLIYLRELNKSEVNAETTDALNKIFNETRAREIENEVLNLRIEVLGLSKKILEAHQISPSLSPVSKLDEFSKTIDQKIERLSQRTQRPHEAVQISKTIETMPPPQTDPISVDTWSIDAISAVFDKAVNKDSVLSSIVALQRLEYERLSNQMMSMMSNIHQNESANSARIATLSKINNKIQQLREHIDRSKRECNRVEKAVKRMTDWGNDADLFTQNKSDIEQTLEERNKRRIEQFTVEIASIMGNETKGLTKIMKLLEGPINSTTAGQINDLANQLELVC